MKKIVTKWHTTKATTRKISQVSIRTAENLDEAWEKTTAKWQNLKDAAQYSKRNRMSTHVDINNVLTCGLCDLYYMDSCDGCPIFIHTNFRACRRTPIAEMAPIVWNTNTLPPWHIRSLEGFIELCDECLEFIDEVRNGEEV